MPQGQAGVTTSPPGVCFSTTHNAPSGTGALLPQTACRIRLHALGRNCMLPWMRAGGVAGNIGLPHSAPHRAYWEYNIGNQIWQNPDPPPYCEHNIVRTPKELAQDLGTRQYESKQNIVKNNGHCLCAVCMDRFRSNDIPFKHWLDGLVYIFCALVDQPQLLITCYMSVTSVFIIRTR